MDRNEVLLKEIDLIQNCIQRMDKNSFLVKGWLISLFTVIIALLPEKFDIKYLSAAGFLSTLCFWYLDGFFLKMETLYRWKYEWVLKNRLICDDYKFDLDPYNKNMWIEHTSETTKREPPILKKMFSKINLPLYAPLLAVMLALFLNTIYCI